MSKEYNEGYRKGYIDGLAAKPVTGWPATQPTPPKIYMALWEEDVPAVMEIMARFEKQMFEVSSFE